MAGGVAALLPMSVAAFGRWTVETVGGESIGEAGWSIGWLCCPLPFIHTYIHTCIT